MLTVNNSCPWRLRWETGKLVQVTFVLQVLPDGSTQVPRVHVDTCCWFFKGFEGPTTCREHSIVHIGTIKQCTSMFFILLMAEILHQLMGTLSHYWQGFLHPRWCNISSINSSALFVLNKMYWPLTCRKFHWNTSRKLRKTSTSWGVAWGTMKSLKEVLTYISWFGPYNGLLQSHQTFQVPKMEVCPFQKGLHRSNPTLFGWDWNRQPHSIGMGLDSYGDAVLSNDVVVWSWLGSCLDRFPNFPMFFL